MKMNRETSHQRLNQNIGFSVEGKIDHVVQVELDTMPNSMDIGEARTIKLVFPKGIQQFL